MTTTERWRRIATPRPESAASLPLPSTGAAAPAPIPPPPCDAAMLAGLASAAALFRVRFGYSLAAPGAIAVLAATIRSFNATLAGLPPMSPANLTVLAAWGAVARGIGSVRDRMGVNLLRPSAGPALSAAIAARQSGAAAPAPWQEDRARSVMHWLALDRAAAALDMPTAGRGALAKLGRTLRALAEADVPACDNPEATAAFISAANNLHTVRGTLGVDLLAPDAADQLQAASKRLRDNLGELPAASALLPSGAGGLTRSALAAFARIDRTQAGDLGLEQLRAESGRLLTSAPLVLAAMVAANGAASV